MYLKKSYDAIILIISVIQLCYTLYDQHFWILQLEVGYQGVTSRASNSGQ